MDSRKGVSGGIASWERIALFPGLVFFALWFTIINGIRHAPCIPGVDVRGRFAIGIFPKGLALIQLG